MADNDRKDDKKKKSEPVLDFRWDSLELAHDKTFSTTIRINLSGWWVGGRPNKVSISVYEGGQEPDSGYSVPVQKGQATFPLIRLEPSHHYNVIVYIGDHQVRKFIPVPELPKPEHPEKEALETEKIQLERARTAKELKELQPVERRRQLKIINSSQQPFSLEVALQRIGKDGNFEAGDVYLQYFKETGEFVFRASRSLVPERVILFSMPDFWDRPRKLVFFLPDDPEVRVTMEVPSRGEKKTEPVVKSASQRIAEAFQRGRQGELLAAKDPAKVLPLATVVGGAVATFLAFRGPEGPGGK